MSPFSSKLVRLTTSVVLATAPIVVLSIHHAPPAAARSSYWCKANNFGSGATLDCGGKTPKPYVRILIKCKYHPLNADFKSYVGPIVKVSTNTASGKMCGKGQYVWRVSKEWF